MSATFNRLRDLTRPTGQEDLLDVAYPVPRWTLSLRHAVFAACAVAVLVLGWLLIQGTRPADPVPVPPHQLPSVSTTAGAPDEQLVVSVVGEVAHPGLATLAPGARVDDALAAAGPLPGADLAVLNLAQRLTDGQQLVVPAEGAAPVVDAAAPVAGTGDGAAVSLNSATAAELTTLDGVGDKTAEAIIAHREATGGFTTLEQLMDVKGIGPAKFEAMRGQVSL